MISVVDSVQDVALESQGDHPLKRIPIEVREIAFLASDSAMTSQPASGKGMFTSSLQSSAASHLQARPQNFHGLPSPAALRNPLHPLLPT